MDDRPTLLRAKASLEAKVDELQRELQRLEHQHNIEVQSLKQEVTLLEGTANETKETVLLMQSILEEKNEAIKLLQAKHDMDLDGQGTNFSKVLKLKDEAYEVLEQRLDSCEAERDIAFSQLKALQTEHKKLSEDMSVALQKSETTAKLLLNKELERYTKRVQELEVALGQEQQKVVTIRESGQQEVRRVRREEQMKWEQEKAQFEAQVQALQAKLMDLDRVVASNDTAVAIAKEESQVTISEKDQEILKLRKELSVMADQIRTSHAAVAKAAEQIEREQSQKQALQSNVTQLQRDMEALHNDMFETMKLSTDQSTELGAHLSIISQLKAENQQLEKIVEGFRHERDEMLAEVSNAKSQISKAQAEARAKEDEVRIVRSELAASAQLAQELQRTYDLMSVTTKRRDESVRQREEELRRLQEKLNEVTLSALQFEGEAKQTKRDLDRAEETIKRLEDMLAKTKRAMQDEIDRSSAKDSTIRQELLTERQRIQEFEKLLKGTTDEKNTARKEITRLQDMVQKLTLLLEEAKQAPPPPSPVTIQKTVEDTSSRERLELLEKYMSTVKTKLIEVCTRELGNTRSTSLNDKSDLARMSVVDITSELTQRMADFHAQLCALAQFASDIRKERYMLCGILLDESVLGPVDWSMTNPEESEEQRRWVAAKQRIPHLVALVKAGGGAGSVDGGSVSREQYDQINLCISTLKKAMTLLRSSRGTGGLVQPQLDEVFQGVVDGLRVMQSIAEKFHETMDLDDTASNASSVRSGMSKGSLGSQALSNIRSAAAPTLTKPK
eukprot:PhF_6_TR37916/c0_g1_i1/m.56653